jgi:hypothetical protein
MSKAKAKAITDPVLAILCRQFPQLKSSVLVFARSMPGSVERTYRLRDDTYLRIRSTMAGDKIVPINDPFPDFTRATVEDIKRAFGRGQREART